MQDILFSEMNEHELKKVASLSYMVGKLHDKALPRYFNPTSYNEHLKIIKNIAKDPNTKILTAKIKDEIVGFCCYSITFNTSPGYKINNILYIHNLGVAPKYQRQGIGSKLIYKTIEKGKTDNIQAIDLNVFMFNKEAMNFYLNLGFEIMDVNLRKVI